MASCFFLLRQFEDVLVYLKSIKAYFSNDDDFNWNYGLACAAAGDYREAKDALLQMLGGGFQLKPIVDSSTCFFFFCFSSSFTTRTGDRVALKWTMLVPFFSYRAPGIDTEPGLMPQGELAEGWESMVVLSQFGKYMTSTGFTEVHMT